MFRLHGLVNKDQSGVLWLLDVGNADVVELARHPRDASDIEVVSLASPRCVMVNGDEADSSGL